MEQHKEIEAIKGIGEKTALLFHKLGIYTVADLLQYYPRNYEVFAAPVSVSSEYIGQIVAIRGIILNTPVLKRVRNLQIVTTSILTDTTKMNLTWFNMPFLKNSLKKGQCFIFRGMLQNSGNAYLIEQPKYYKEEDYCQLIEALQPLYSLTAHLSNQTISKSIKKVIKETEFEEFFSDEFLKKYNLIGRNEAIREIHFPKNMDELVIARRRLVFEEFLLFILNLRMLKEKTELIENCFEMVEVAETTRLIERLPYRLTGAQMKAWKDICNDLLSEKTMNRLVQGDVGSGKTIIAVLAAVMAGINSYQTAFMVPTEVLATQHFETVTKMMTEYGIPLKAVLLTGSVTGKNRKEAYQLIETGEAKIIIGTHALIQEKVTYHKLALAITDEQHRFGVRQRELLSQKTDAKMPHILVMSATPIPRTLGIILYGDLDVSVIDELPADRQPIKNCVVNTDYRKKAYQFILNEVQAGRQAYVICPMVEENEALDAEDVISYTQKLKGFFPPQVQISYLHGKMKPIEKTRTMEAFARNDIHILVSTTVVEVGVNVPNASVMLIENAERFGLSQLHQLRGRIGRGAAQSYCIFMSGQNSKQTMERLEILNKSNDGFFIAAEDLKTRGPGDLFGIRQSGALAFAIGDIFTDATILQSASEAAEQLLKDDTVLKKPEYQALNACLEEYRKKSNENIQL
ncbi:MAG TPA: ATP-dependent DNA helicase RecG [Lachnospiraceae bacterium]|nr:ATP-dependent DNA helicase RecG [Lachnospiraceae bacterium]